MDKSKHIIILAIVIFASVSAAFFVYPPSFLKGKFVFKRDWKLGLDLIGGSYLVYEIDLKDVPSSERNSVTSGLKDIMERRVDIFGVSEPQVYLTQSKESANLVVELAGVKDVKQAIEQIGRTAFLDFREVKAEEGQEEVEFIATDLTGRYLQKAQPIFDSVTGGPQISLQFNSEGSRLFEKITDRNIGKPLAIFLDDGLISAPVVKDKIVGGRAVITGKFTTEEAKQLASLLNAGALPAPIHLINQQTIGAALGKGSLDKAVFAGLIGALAIIVFMLVYYRFFGIFACFSLLIYIILTLTVFKAMPVTLTLAGIAGFVLSIGMAVDANILIFERAKEEIKRGLSRESAVEEGFKRAWTSIRDSNISSIMSSVILYYFTSSFVKGFALTLLIGVIVNLFTSLTVSRTFFRVFARK